MSTLVTSNISDGTTSVGTGYVVNGSAKAWVNFNGTGTIAIRDSLNAASLIDRNTGDYEINYTSAMSNTSYGSSTEAGGANNDYAITSVQDVYTAANVGVQCRNISGIITDYVIVCVAIHGDLA